MQNFWLRLEVWPQAPCPSKGLPKEPVRGTAPPEAMSVLIKPCIPFSVNYLQEKEGRKEGSGGEEGEIRLPNGMVGEEYFSSVQFSRSVVSYSLRPRELQHARPSCPSPTPGVYPNPCPSSWWCHPAISSSVVPFSSCPQSFPNQGLFQSFLFAWGGQSTGVSASTSVLPMNTQDWSPSGWTGLISLQSKGL